MTSLLFMLVRNGLLLFAIRDGGEKTQMLTIVTGSAMLGMLLEIRASTNGWIALVAARRMLFGAPVMVFSILVQSLARASGGERG